MAFRADFVPDIGGNGGSKWINCHPFSSAKQLILYVEAVEKVRCADKYSMMFVYEWTKG
jgi:hypothetical protein